MLGALLLLAGGAVLGATFPVSPLPRTAVTPALPIALVVEEYTSGETLEHLCQEPLVAEVTVSSLGRSHWNTPAGTRPSGISAHSMLTQGYSIYTPVVFSTMKVLVDHRPQPTREYTIPGGQVGQDRLQVATAPTLAPKQRALLVFIPGLEGGSPGYDQHWMIVYWTYRIVGNEVVTQEQGIQQGVVALPEQREPLAHLEDYLEQGCLAH